MSSSRLVILFILVLAIGTLATAKLLHNGNDPNIDYDETAGRQLMNDLPVLPERVISVFGLESSGTKFVTQAITEVSGIMSFGNERKLNRVKIKEKASRNLWRVDRERQSVESNGETRRLQHSATDAWGFNGRLKKRLRHNGIVEIQHISLPWGDTCDDYAVDAITMPYLLPEGCGCSEHVHTRAILWPGCLDEPMNRACEELGLNEYAFYPKRFFVNITSHVRWYRDRGALATAIVVVRDHNVALQSKHRDHCNDETLAKAENEWGLRLINEAMNELSHEHRSGEPPEIILVSYETMMSLGVDYLHVVFDKLQLRMRDGFAVNPHFKDGNTKYFHEEFDERPLNRLRRLM
mmetsp:Transcript_23451/g.28670  ORF Transcript_23451/g.28670 Transcript_23451/m.28670 type:complete len:351 (-) Transcript_23451:159-1211(-)|eukprot:CAMPEP_0172487160 /NCGR_PEP_ID=MMETSP1066-20121228/16104_1 /TAXON_ID=671091 /ORGANISM="Coscinodiscus wailesii, Strain CCMP2513" /LENGTH=350 /DNA_ID=CAMNT_0013253589 /DNA_START=72 /DNA_END=1124 /DNA_ORIENTATION=+